MGRRSIALRERYGRTIPFVGKLESEGVEIARGIIEERGRFDKRTCFF